MEAKTIKKVNLKRVESETRAERICGRSGCNKNLSDRQKRFCSNECLRKNTSLGLGPYRPSEYKPEYAGIRLKEYLDGCKRDLKLYMYPQNDSKVLLLPLPTLEDFANFLGGFLPQTLRNWARQYPEFEIALEHIRSEQKIWLISNGLSGKFSPVITKLLLMNNHGMSDKHENKNIDISKVIRDLYQAADMDREAESKLLLI